MTTASGISINSSLACRGRSLLAAVVGRGHEELQRNLVEADHDPALIERRIATMRSVFPDAMVDGYEQRIEGITCEPRIGHVLAAAVRANADVLVTFNL